MKKYYRKKEISKYDRPLISPLSWMVMVDGVIRKKGRNFGHLKGVDTVKKLLKVPSY